VPVERRETVRYFPRQGQTFHHLQANMEGCAGEAQVRNLSAGGISLVFDRRVEPAAVVNLELRNIAKALVRKYRISVIYLQEHPTGQWILGGAFTRKLKHDELQALLAE
jgi:hypothetical protein